MLNFIYRFAAICLVLVFLFSCSTVLDPNKEFNNKYQPQVRSILDSIPQKNSNGVDYYNKESFGSITQQDVVNESLRSEQQYYPYFDIRKFGVRTPKTYYPNMELYDQSRFQRQTSQIPPDIFEVSYKNRIYPPFKYQGARFDAISVPKNDIYGIETAMTNKEYLLVGNNFVQNSVDNIKNKKNTFDAKNSEILIAQKKRLRHERKIAKIFGLGAITKEGIKIEDEKNN